MFIIEDYTCVNDALCWDCNIVIFFYLQCKIVRWESQQTLHNGGSWVPSLQIFMPRSLLADRLRGTWRDTPEQIGRSMWLGQPSPSLVTRAEKAVGWNVKPTPSHLELPICSGVFIQVSRSLSARSDLSIKICSEGTQLPPLCKVCSLSRPTILHWK